MRRRSLILWSASAALWGCSTNQSLVLVGNESVPAAHIDQAPLEILPGGALFLSRLDAQAMFRSYAGARMAEIISNLLPLGPESGFSPHRDVSRVYGAVYAMQGADFVSVVQGNFNLAAIEQAAQARAATPSGAPIVVTQYAGRRIYTVANLGFVPLTQHTVLSGNETGMRRALDKLRSGQLQASLRPWMHELLANDAAPYVVVGDVGGQAVVAAAAQQVPFLNELTMVRVLGNFEEPGMNVVGSLTYRTPESAAAGAVGLGEVRKLAYAATLLSTWGFGGTMPDLEVQPQGTNVAFATKIDTTLLDLVLGLMADITKPIANRASPSPWGLPQ